jgi:hypothetical protein
MQNPRYSVGQRDRSRTANSTSTGFDFQATTPLVAMAQIAAGQGFACGPIDRQDARKYFPAMVRMTLFAILLLSGLLLSGLPAFAEEPDNCSTGIEFGAGRSSASITGSVGSEEPFPCYTLTVGKGQTATFKFTRTNGNMAFTIYGVVDGRDAYSFETDAKTYKFIVFQKPPAGPDAFTLAVSVE